MQNAQIDDDGSGAGWLLGRPCHKPGDDVIPILGSGGGDGGNAARLTRNPHLDS